jgi:arginine deiminase
MTDLFSASAYGGPGWSPRTVPLRQEIGRVWAACGVASEWAPLQAVLLHRPGAELAAATDPDAVQQLAEIDLGRAQAQHDALTQAYRDAGVVVHYVEPDDTPPPNLIFCADLLFMTPEGAIVGRPASTVRAGEERFIARRLAALGIPILRTIRGTGTFEGADAAWIDAHTVLLATGLRSNAAGAAQVTSLLYEMGVEVVPAGLPYGAMHLMGQLRLVDRDLAVAWPGRVPFAAVEALQARGYTVLFLPDEEEAKRGMALNFVTLAPRQIMMPGGNPITRAFYEAAGITCHTVDVSELVKAAGGVGCLTGILQRGSDAGLAFDAAVEEDYDKFLALQREQTAGYLAETLERMGMTWQEYKDRFRTVGRVYCIRQAGQVAGFYWIEERAPLLHLHGLILKDEFQGQGIGSQVLQKLETEYKQRMVAIELGVHESNTRAIALYERFGYKTVNRLEDLGFLVMQKHLAGE